MNGKVIDLITYHRAYNYGAVLQTLATVEFFSKQGYIVNVIDYTPKYLQNFGTLRNTFNQVDNKKQGFIKRFIFTIIKTPSYKKLKRVFSKFIEMNFKLTDSYNSIEDLIRNKPTADFFCSGSDQIWNNYYTGEFDKAFFLDFVSKNDKCISFSSSFGKNKFDDKEKEEIKKLLKKYNLLSVREQDGKALLDELSIKPNMVLYDPTLLVDSNYWDNFSGRRIIKDKYILVYQLHGDSDAYEKALEYAKNKKLKVVRIITMFHQVRIGCKNIIVPKIPEFISLFKYAECIFTDSFHGTVFSIIFEKKVGVRLPVRFSNRITSFLSSIDSTNIIINDLNSWNKDVNNKYIKNANIRMNENKNKMIETYQLKLKELNKR